MYKKWFLLAIISIASLPIIFYLSWCWGLWGRDIIGLRYLLQCNCPSFSEPSRYPSQFQVMVSACSDPSSSIRVSPGGHFLQFFENDKGLSSLNLETGIKFQIPQAQSYIFITDDLIWVNHRENQSYLFEISTQRHYLVNRLSYNNLPTLPNRSFDPSAMVPMLRRARQVFIVEDMVLMLDVDSGNYKVYERDLTGEGGRGEKSRQYLDKNGITYQEVGLIYYGELRSHTGAFIFRPDGIYLATSGKRIVENYSVPEFGHLPAVGWVYDDRGVILQPIGSNLLDLRSIYYGLGTHFWTPLPILMLKVPEQYLLSK